MRECVNPKCIACRRIVYSVATRCPMCKWDLQFMLPASEVAASQKTVRDAPRPR
jgi:hypothetical protein